MERPPYYRLEEMLAFMPEPNLGIGLGLLNTERERFEAAPGSSHNHQAWPGGYLDHLRETMNYAILFHRAETSTGRTLPFSLADALLAIFLHDFEKLWLIETIDGGWRRRKVPKEDKVKLKWEKIVEYGFVLTPEIVNAVTYAEGEGQDYRPDRRVMGELAGFVHMMDVMSARVRHDHPKAGDPWSGR